MACVVVIKAVCVIELLPISVSAKVIVVGLALIVGTADLTIIFFNPIIDDEPLPVPRSDANESVNVASFAIFKLFKVIVFVIGFDTLLLPLYVQFNPVTVPKLEVTVQLGVLESLATITNA